MIPTDKLKRWRELADGAFAGKWGARDVYVYRSDNSLDHRQVCRIPTVQVDDRHPHPTAAFIAASREAVPALLDEVERLRALCIKACDLADNYLTYEYETWDVIEPEQARIAEIRRAVTP